MATYFIRHTARLGIDDAARQKLWDSQRIAIHYPEDKSGNTETDSSSVNPDDYKGVAKKPMRALRALAQSGGYVCAVHHGYKDCMLGYVEPNSNIELLEVGGSREHGRQALLKTLRLTKVKTLKPLDQPSWLYCRPRQGTLSRWRKVQTAIEDLVEGRRGEPELRDLTPPRLETMCSELLRLPECEELGLPRLAHLLLPVGGTMKDLDIFGLATDGSKLAAQVTFDPLDEVRDKFERLLSYKDPKGANLVFFCDCPEKTTHEGVIVFPIKKAYEVFTQSRLGQAWLEG